MPPWSPTPFLRLFLVIAYPPSLVGTVTAHGFAKHQYSNLLPRITAEAKDEKFMSSSGLEATQQELDAFGDDDGADGEDDDDEESDE